MIKKIMKKLKFIFFKIFIKCNYSSTKKEIQYTILKNVMDFKKFKNETIYKDENWNYIKNLKNYLAELNNAKYEDNVCKSSRCEITNKKVLIKSENKLNNWNCFFLKKIPSYNYELVLDLIIYSEFEEIQIAFKYQNLGTRYRFMIRNNEETVFECVYNGMFYHRIKKKPFKLKLGKKYKLKIIVLKDKYLYYINDKLIFSIKEHINLINGQEILLILYNNNPQKNSVNCVIEDLNINLINL